MLANDGNTTVDELRKMVSTFVEQRSWKPFHNPKNLSMSLAIEVSELMEHFQWLTSQECEVVVADPLQREPIEEELADCLAYVLALANAMEMDLSQALNRKMVLNAKKYPATQQGASPPSEE